jgi:hypothetical protein
MAIRPTPPDPLWCVCSSVLWSLLRYEPGVDPLLEPEVGGAPDPDGGVPDGAFEFEPLPMLGQFFVEPEDEPEPVEEPEPVDELEEPEPVLPALELDDGVVEDELDVEGFDVELVPVFPELPVVVDVVAASATSAPPATRPDVSAPMASTLRKRICMGALPCLLVPAHSNRWSYGALRI